MWNLYGTYRNLTEIAILGQRVHPQNLACVSVVARASVFNDGVAQNVWERILQMTMLDNSTGGLHGTYRNV